MNSSHQEPKCFKKKKKCCSSEHDSSEVINEGKLSINYNKPKDNEGYLGKG